MTIVSDPQHALSFGGLNLIGSQADYLANGWTIEASGDDADWGNPVPIEVAVASWLQDGANISIERHENRELFVRLQVRATNSDLLALAEETLVAQCGSPNFLKWTPPDGVGAICVFDVATSTLEEVTDDLGDLQVRATYGLRIKAFPFVRANDETTVSIPAPSLTAQTFTTVDACTSTTGWAGSVRRFSDDAVLSSPSPSTSGGQVIVAGNSLPTTQGVVEVRASRTGLAVSLATKPYIRISANAVFGGAVSAIGMNVHMNGVLMSCVLQNGSVYWFDTTGLGSTLNSVEVGQIGSPNAPGSSITMNVADITQSNVLGDQSTNRQLYRTVPVLGSARTEGTISLEDASNALGDVLVHTMPTITGLLQPSLRGTLVSGNSATPDAATVSGVYTSLASIHQFSLAASGLLPGTYALMARIRHTSAGDRVLAWAASSRVGGNNLGGAQSGSTTVTLAANTWKTVDLARLTLPPVRVGANGNVWIELTGVANMDLDEAWLFNLDDGSLTWIDCGTAAPSSGGTANRLFIDSPTPQEPTYQYYIGTMANRADSFQALTVKSEGHHELKPQNVNVFTVTPNSTASLLGFRYYRRAHTRIRNP